MDLHYGQIVEKRVRRSGISITELARNTNVNRRSVYNWFNQKRLSANIIHRIGCAINYDFTTDFPQLFSAGGFKFNRFNPDALMEEEKYPIPEPKDNEGNWKDKYVNLLEDYNSLLQSKMANSDNDKV
jgi:transcriptional regulator with XRE-family HTH domain